MNEEQTPEQAPKAGGLTPRQELFCLEYLKDFNATAAAKRAGYAEASAHVSGSRTLDKPEVQTFLRAELDKRNNKIRLATEAVNNELLDITFLDRGEFLDEDGDLKNLKDLPENMRSAVQVKTTKVKCEGRLTTTTTYSLFNKIQMMDKISRRILPKKQDADNEDSFNTAVLGDGTIIRY